MPVIVPSSIGRKYDRFSPPSLPMHRMIIRSSALTTLPSYVDTRIYTGPRKDQGSEGACTGHAFTEAIEWIFRRNWAQAPILSPQYFYAEELIEQGDFPNDVGSDGFTACKVAMGGCCELSLYPYVPGQIATPTTLQIQNAMKFSMGAWHGLAGSQVALSVLGDRTPWPVLIGFDVYQSFESDQVAQTGVIPIPQADESMLGGHEVMALGYDIGLTPMIRPSAAGPSVLCMNSWGTDWGWEGGYFWMPLEILDHPSTDLKIVHSGHPWA